MTIEALQTDHYQSHLRNKLIAEAFYLTGNIEKYGSGFIRIRKELQHYPEVNFSVEEMGGGLLVTFEQSGGAGGGVTTQKTTQKTEERILEIIRARPSASRREISKELGDITQDGVKYHLDLLKQLRRIRRVGPDRGGHWEVLE